MGTVVKELLDLPDDALVHILGVAGIRECGAMARCCTRLRPLLGPDALVWRIHLRRMLPLPTGTHVDTSGAAHARALLMAYGTAPPALCPPSHSPLTSLAPAQSHRPRGS